MVSDKKAASILGVDKVVEAKGRESNDVKSREVDEAKGKQFVNRIHQWSRTISVHLDKSDK